MMSMKDPVAFAVCLGFDAFRLCLGKATKNFTPMEIAGLTRRAAENQQPLVFHSDILAAHAQFGGDLREMQRTYDMGGLPPRARTIKGRD